jgi:GTPase
MFVDRVKIELHAGTGGDGCSSMRREKFIPRGGPDGGNGGSGASVILEAKLGVNSLSWFAGRGVFKAKNGNPGEGSSCHGRAAEDVVIYVPPGTTVLDAEGGWVIKDLQMPGDSVIAARGGKGGRGNASFKNANNRAPREKTLGDVGEIRSVVLELKSIADVGLVGKPNAGKSTFLARVSSARPEIADYPFTTKFPNLGIVELDGARSFVLADIPGLIEGASEGVGLGHEFLRHVERAGLLVHLIEPSPTDATDPIENYKAIRIELKQYDESLGQRDEVIAVTKCELGGADEVAEALRQISGSEVAIVSAATGEGMTDLLEIIFKRVEDRRAKILAEGGEVTPLRVSDIEAQRDERPRLPPHLAGPTSKLSNDTQASDIELVGVERKRSNARQRHDHRD